MYEVDFSKATISAVADKILPMLQEWRVRPLEKLWMPTQISEHSKKSQAL
nr:transposase [Sulfurospirillum deleyianum]